jgi:hypothetical protein
MSDTDRRLARRALLGRMLGAGATVAAGLLLPAPAHACELRFQPGQVEAGPDGKASFEAFIFIEHRRCVISLPPECIHLAPSGLSIVQQSPWSRAKHDLYRASFQVQLSGDRGALRIWRDCAKKGISEGTITVVRGRRP